ncbi:MAG: hypothetical protein L6Q95_04980 [Planctomycetes bacterium]|nr:hypothetical protein [Planctomycetota bacterium]
MRRRMLAALLAVLAPLPLVALFPDRAEAEEPGTDAAPAPKEIVASLMKALHANKGAVRIGMSVAAAERATPGAANHIDERILPLRGSFLDKEGRLNGTLDWDVDLGKGTKVGLIRAVALTGRFDRKDMGKAIVAAGKEIGIALEPDEKNKDTWFDAGASGVEIWVTIGDGVIVVDAQILVE